MFIKIPICLSSRLADDRPRQVIAADETGVGTDVYDYHSASGSVTKTISGNGPVLTHSAGNPWLQWSPSQWR